MGAPARFAAALALAFALVIPVSPQPASGATVEPTPSRSPSIFEQLAEIKRRRQEAMLLLERSYQLAGHRYDIDPDFLKAIATASSDENPNDISKTGALGLMQLTPDVARQYHVDNPLDPVESIFGAARYLVDIQEQLKKRGIRNDLVAMAAAYKAGPQTVEKYRDIPPDSETQGFVRKVLWLYLLGKPPPDRKAEPPRPRVAQSPQPRGVRFRGGYLLRWGMDEDAFMAHASAESARSTQDVNSCANGTCVCYNCMPAPFGTVTAYFNYHRFYRAHISFLPDELDHVQQSLMALGNPSSEQETTWKNQLGTEFSGIEETWFFREVTVRLACPDSTFDNAGLTMEYSPIGPVPPF